MPSLRNATFDSVEQMVAAGNKKARSGTVKQIVKRASDTQALELLSKHVRVAVEQFFADGRDCREAMKELRSCMAVLDRRVK